MLLHRPSLQSATPIEASGDLGDTFEGRNVVWKRFRAEGVHIVVVVYYFDEHSIGLTGNGLEKIHFSNVLLDDGSFIL